MKQKERAKNMKKVVSMILALAMVFALCACGAAPAAAPAASSAPAAAESAPAAEPITIKIGTTVSENNPIGVALASFKDKLAEATDGRIDVQVFYSSQLGNEQEMLTQARQNDIQMYVSNPVKTSGTIKAHAAMEGFFLYDNWDHAMRFLDSDAAQVMMDAYNVMDLQGLVFFASGFRMFTNSKRPLATIDDFNGLKIRGYSETQIKAWESVGCNTSSVAWNELFSAMQQGLIDGQECAIASLYDAKFYEVQKYLSLTEHQLSVDCLVVNSAFFAGLSAEDQELIRSIAKEVAVVQRQTIVDNEAALLDEIKAYGVEVNSLTTEDKAVLREAIGAVVNPSIIEIAGQENYDIVMKGIEAARG